MKHLVLVRLASEVTLKSKRTRHAFMGRLMHNLTDALRTAGIKHRIAVVWGRVYIHADSPTAVTVAARVFGISSCSLVDEVVPATVQDITDRGLELYRDRVAGKRFAVRCHRVGNHDFKSHDVEMQLGGALRPFAARVDLTNPEITVQVEIRNREAYLFSERTLASSGLPIGVEGSAIALISGGYDSAVAAWLVLKRGVELDYVFCNLGGDAYERAVVQVAKLLADEWSYGTRPRLHVIDFAEPMRELRAKVKQSYWQVILKRLMYRAAAHLAQQYNALAIVTGEAIGQVSSQTLHNLSAIEPASALPVLRPLIAYEKEEIIARARFIGTAALSEQVKEYCAIAPGRPVTATTADRLAREEKSFDHSVLEQAVAQHKTLDLRALTATDLAAPYLFTNAIPDSAVVIDCRPESQYAVWHHPNAVHRDEWDLLRDFKRLDRNQTYVLYCAHGLQTAYIAEKMQNAGYDAYSFKGGLRGIRQYNEAGVSPG